MKKHLCKNVLSAVFFLSWFAIFCIAGSLDQYIISVEQAVAYSVITFAALGISGVLSGLLTIPKPQDKYDRKK